jgi:hypothetical protein
LQCFRRANEGLVVDVQTPQNDQRQCFDEIVDCQSIRPKFANTYEVNQTKQLKKMRITDKNAMHKDIVVT